MNCFFCCRSEISGILDEVWYHPIFVLLTDIKPISSINIGATTALIHRIANIKRRNAAAVSVTLFSEVNCLFIHTTRILHSVLRSVQTITWMCKQQKLTLNILFQTCCNVVQLPDTFDFTLNGPILKAFGEQTAAKSTSAAPSPLLLLTACQESGIGSWERKHDLYSKAQCSVTQPPWQ